MKPIMMRHLRTIILLSVVMGCLSTTGQTTQKGYVKTKGRLSNNGVVVHGTRLPGASVLIRNINQAVEYLRK